MKKFFNEFKKFIARGNIVDMAVGVIVGSSFTAIVNALSNNILKPVINYVLALVLGKNALSEVYTFLKIARPEDDPTAIDLANSIYIDWGAFILAIINFLIVAFVLFCIVKAVNKMREDTEKLEKKKLSKEDRKILKSRGIKLSNKKAVKNYLEEKAKAEAKAKEKAEAEAKAKAEAEKLAKASTDELLRAILEEMKKKKKKK